ncbi:uncharacterized protein LOC127636150 [Xyrauchen texanus]|uniref:uncharacterized protein LOC127636150 n=1 Tax=Xyrauchen texanus TaxID=154827 RepID=UPI002241C89D|nr:uncharacterized protein LOC127636150 [Xyrauchen texanus]
MDVKSFYGSRPRTFLALVPENPEDSDADLSDDDPVDDPDYLPTPAEESGDTSFDSLDEEEVASTSSSSKPPSKKKMRMGKNSLKTVSLAELQDTPEPSPPDGKEGRRRLWRHEDIETFQVPDSSFNLLVLDLCISNAWLVYKRDCSLLNEALLPLKKFRLAVAHTLAKVNKPASKVGRPSSSSPPQMSSNKKSNTPRPSHPQPDVQYDNFGHLPLHSNKRGRCNLCPKGVSRWKCQKCHVFLCMNAKQECFAAYHQK